MTDQSRPDDIGTELGRFHERVTGAVADYQTSLQEDVLGAIAESAARAREHLSAVPLDGGVAAYRAALRDAVIRPLLDDLEAASLGSRVAEAHAALLQQLSTESESLQQVLERPEPEGLYASALSDSLYRRLRKSQVRAARKAASVGKKLTNAFRRTAPAEGTPARPVQQVPLRRLAAYHAMVRLPLELQPLHESLCRAAAEAVAAVSGTAAAHAYEVLSAEAGGGETGVNESRDAFEAVLAKTADDLATAKAVEAFSMRTEALRERLDRDVSESGTFMLDLADRDVVRSSVVTRKAKERDQSWKAWHDRACKRLEILDCLLVLREIVFAIQEGLASSILDRAVAPTAAALIEGEKSLDRRSAKAKKEFSGRVEARSVRSHLKGALATVEKSTRAAFEEEAYADWIPDQFKAAIDGLSEAADQLPREMDVNVVDVVDPEERPKAIPLREHASRAFDAFLVERLEAEAAALRSMFESVRDAVESVPEILRFNLGTAADDLDAGEEDFSDDGAESETAASSTAQSSARELVVDGLARSADVVGAAARRLQDETPPRLQAAREIIDDAFLKLCERLQVEERVREQILDLRSEAEAGARRAAERTEQRLRRAAVAVRKAYRGAARRARTWVRMGQQAAGLAAASDEERFATLDVLIDTERLLDNLPLVYRRLFRFEPVRDPGLLEARDSEVEAVRRHLHRWQGGLTNALVLTGFHGSGHTSFLNVLKQTLFVDADVRTVDIDKRLQSEEELVHLLQDALGIGGDVSSLRELTERLFDAAARDRLLVCAVEHLEHLYTRRIGGSELTVRFLTFLSRTDSRILWIVTVSDYGWQVIRKAAPSATGLVVTQPLEPLSRDNLEALILNRHRRSGLPLRFGAPTKEASPLLLRRLKRARTDDERQALLRAEYFDRLQRAGGQNIMLSMLYWLRSTEHDEEEGVIRVRPLTPMSFEFLQRLDLDQAFTLKAMLEHASLTPEEHSDLFMMSIPSSVEVFESLGNLLLLEPADKGKVASRFAFESVEEGIRYRIRPLLIHPVIQYLRGRNILH